MGEVNGRRTGLSDVVVWTLCSRFSGYACLLLLLVLHAVMIVHIRRYDLPKAETKTSESTTIESTTTPILNAIANYHIVGPEQTARESLHQLCAEEKCLPPLRLIPCMYRGAMPSYPVAVCAIEKSMSTALIGIVCFLRDAAAFRADNRSITDDPRGSPGHWKNEERFCFGKNNYTWIDNAMTDVKQLMETRFAGRVQPKPTPVYLTVVRDPLERFVSGFVDKCMREKNCYKTRCAPADVECVLRVALEQAAAFAISADAFQLGYEDLHLIPQNWHCNFHQFWMNYTVVHYGSSGVEKARMVSQIAAALRKALVPSELIDEIVEAFSKTEAVHATKGMEEAEQIRTQIVSNRRLLRLFLQYSYFDYVLFGFTPPEPYMLP